MLKLAYLKFCTPGKKTEMTPLLTQLPIITLLNIFCTSLYLIVDVAIENMIVK